VTCLGPTALKSCFLVRMNADTPYPTAAIAVTATQISVHVVQKFICPLRRWISCVKAFISDTVSPFSLFERVLLSLILTCELALLAIIGYGSVQIGMHVKKHAYLEGPQALENFEEGMKALFKVSKDEVVRAEKKMKKKRASSRAQNVSKPKLSDKD